MKIIEDGRIAFAQGLYEDNPVKVMEYIRKHSVGIDKLIMITRISLTDANTLFHTFWFKGCNGEKAVRYTYTTEVL